jgi:hypothetical protein
MQMRKLSRLMFAINEALRQSDHTRSLRLILNNFANLAESAVLRERVALVLAEKGRKNEAVEIYEMVGRHYANAGYPARALAAAKQMQSLKPDTTNLLDHIATLYNIRSPFTSPDRRARPLPEPDQIELDAGEPRLEVDDLLELATERALDKKGLAGQPGDLPTIPLLSLLPQETFRQVLDHIEYELFDQVQPILEQSKALDELVWTVSEDLVLEDGDDAMYIPAGALIGLSSFGQSGRGAEVDVLSQPGSEVVRLSTEAIRAISAQVPDFPSRLATLRRHAMTERLIQRHPMFAGLDPEERVDVIETFTGMRVTRGEVIIRQNTPSPGLFIILDGEVDIVRQDQDWEITVATLRAGDVFGEIGLVADKPAIAGCVMTHAGHLLHLSRPDFHELGDRFPSVRQYTADLADERLNEAVLSAADLAEVE